MDVNGDGMVDLIWADGDGDYLSTYLSLGGSYCLLSEYTRHHLCAQGVPSCK